MANITSRGRSLRTLYWGTQLGGWGAYVGLGVLWSLFTKQGTSQLWQLALIYVTGVGVSHGFRWLILKQNMLDQHLARVLPRLTLAAVALGLFAFLLESLLHELLRINGPSMLERPAVELFSRVLNWTLLLLIWAMGYFAYNYFIRHRREEIRILRLETANRENQLLNLRAQMNPHFMFNALNGIRALVDEDPAAAKRAITQLSAILRNAMASVKRTVVPLGEEIDIVKAYLALEAMRYEERLRVRFELEPELDRFPVPPMLLQTLVENAVRHGVARLPGGGDLIVSAMLVDGDLRLTVHNSGEYTPGQVNGTGIGLRNTRRRLEIIYGGKGRITIGNRDGMVVTEVVLPLDRPLRGSSNTLENENDRP